MAYTNVSGKTIKRAFGKFKGYAYEAISVGDLCGLDNSHVGFIVADEEASVAARCVALENIAAGDTGWFGAAAVVAAPASESSGVFSVQNMFAAADVAAVLYLDGGANEGLVSVSAGSTYAQEVGYVISRTEMMIIPAVSLSGTALALSGNLSAGGTLGVTGNTSLGGALAVTGATTATGKITANGGLTLGAGLCLGAAEAVTIAGGVATVTKPFVNLAGQGGENDQLDTLTYTGAAEGQLCILSTSGTKTITVDDANIDLGAATRTIAAPGTYLVLIYNGTSWGELAYIAGDNV